MGIAWIPVLRIAWKLLIVILELLIGVLIIVGFRLNCRFSSELDRLGSDFSLYGYGIGVSLLCGTQIGRPVLRPLKPETVTLIICLALILNLLLYIFNMNLSKKMRDLLGFSEGIDTLPSLAQFVATPQGYHLFTLSVIAGTIPTFILATFDILMS